jgi:single-strand DNA-binding protein
MNRVTLIGNCGKDPEIRSTQGGSKIANLTIATTEDWTDKVSGDRKSATEWHRISCFNDQVTGVIERFVKKGSKILVEGKLTTRKWTDQQGQDRYTTEVNIGRFGGQLILLDGKPQGGDTARQAPEGRQGGYPQESGQSRAPTGGGDVGDEDIPFCPEWR